MLHNPTDNLTLERMPTGMTIKSPGTFFVGLSIRIQIQWLLVEINNSIGISYVFDKERRGL